MPAGNNNINVTVTFRLYGGSTNRTISNTFNFNDGRTTSIKLRDGGLGGVSLTAN
jgi:hypothetical protein